MLDILKRHKIVITAVLLDLFLFWLLFYSGIVLPFINPGAEQYKEMSILGTSFPRDTNQMMLWYLIHIPASLIIGTFIPNIKFHFLAVIQTGIIVYFIEKFISRRVKAETKS